MPQMGESIAEGTITRWLKQVGEHVERDEPLFEISTDKVDAEIPSPVAGTLTEVLFKEGDTVEVNKVVAYIGDGNGASASASGGSVTATTQTQPAPSEAAPAPASQAAVSAPAPPPPAATSQQSAPLAQASATSTQSPASIASTQPTPAVSEVAGRSYDSQRPGAEQEGQASPPATAARGEQTVEELRRTRSSPLVRNIAAEHNIDITRLEGTGASGRVTKNDILSFIEQGGTTTAGATTTQPATSSAPPATAAAAAPAAHTLKPSEGDRVEPMSNMRKKIAEHMTLSQRTSAHVATVYEIDMTRIAKLREQHRKTFLERYGTKLTFMPFIFQAVTSAIRKFPIFNSQVGGDQIIYKRDINLGMAVALDWGLIVPVIKRADELSIPGLSLAANDLADRARAKQLKPDEVGGGTFTITNPGVFGGLFGTPIINQPQVAILGVGTIEKRPKVITTPDGDDLIAIRYMAYFALSFDHRIIDGADAERFLGYVKQLLEAGQWQI